MGVADSTIYYIKSLKIGTGHISLQAFLLAIVLFLYVLLLCTSTSYTDIV